MLTPPVENTCELCEGRLIDDFGEPPIESQYAFCLDCGYHAFVITHTLDLEAVNDKRSEYGLPPLTQLKEQN